MVNENLVKVTHDNTISYQLVDGKKLPGVLLQWKNGDPDYINVPLTENILKTEVENSITSYNGNMEEMNWNEEDLNGIRCFYAQYRFMIDSDSHLLSNQLIGKTYFIPSHLGVYEITLLTYQEDTNDYKFNEFIHSMDTSYLEKVTKNKKEESRNINRCRQKQKICKSMQLQMRLKRKSLMKSKVKCSY